MATQEEQHEIDEFERKIKGIVISPIISGAKFPVDFVRYKFVPWAARKAFEKLREAIKNKGNSSGSEGQKLERTVRIVNKTADEKDKREEHSTINKDKSAEKNSVDNNENEKKESSHSAEEQKQEPKINQSPSQTVKQDPKTTQSPPQTIKQEPNKNHAKPPEKPKTPTRTSSVPKPAPKTAPKTQQSSNMFGPTSTRGTISNNTQAKVTTKQPQTLKQVKPPIRTSSKMAAANGAGKKSTDLPKGVKETNKKTMFSNSLARNTITVNNVTTHNVMTKTSDSTRIEKKSESRITDDSKKNRMNKQSSATALIDKKNGNGSGGSSKGNTVSKNQPLNSKDLEKKTRIQSKNSGKGIGIAKDDDKSKGNKGGKGNGGKGNGGKGNGGSAGSLLIKKQNGNNRIDKKSPKLDLKKGSNGRLKVGSKYLKKGGSKVWKYSKKGGKLAGKAILKTGKNVIKGKLEQVKDALDFGESDETKNNPTAKVAKKLAVMYAVKSATIAVKSVQLVVKIVMKIIQLIIKLIVKIIKKIITKLITSLITTLNPIFAVINVISTISLILTIATYFVGCDGDSGEYIDSEITEPEIDEMIDIRMKNGGLTQREEDTLRYFFAQVSKDHLDMPSPEQDPGLSSLLENYPELSALLKDSANKPLDSQTLASIYSGMMGYSLTNASLDDQVKQLQAEGECVFDPKEIPSDRDPKEIIKVKVKVGDLVYYGDEANGTTHAAIYTGNGECVEVHDGKEICVPIQLQDSDNLRIYRPPYKQEY